MSENRAVKLNIIVGVFSQLLSVFINYLTKQAIYAYLGADYMGMQVVFGNVCDIITIAFSGIGTTLLVRMYPVIAKKDNFAMSSLWNYFNQATRAITAASAVIGAAASFVVIWILESSFSSGKVICLYLLYLTQILIYTRFRMDYYFLLAHEKMYLTVLIYGAVDLAAMSVQIVILRLVQNYVLFLVCICIKNIIECLIIRVLIKTRYLKSIDASAELSPDEKSSVKKDMKYIAFSKVGDLLMFSTDSIIISKIISVALSGLYSNYYFIVGGIENIIYTIFDALMSRMGNKYVFSDNRDKLFGYLRMCSINIMITAVCVSGLYWLTDTFITIWMGENALIGQYVVVLSAMELYLQITIRSIDAFRINEGIFKEITNMIVFRGVFNVILSLILGVFFGLKGIMAATVISDLATVYWYEPYLMYKHFKAKLRYELAYQIISLIATAGSLVLSGAAISGIHLDHWMGFIVKGLIITACALIFSGIISLIMNFVISKIEVNKEG